MRVLIFGASITQGFYDSEGGWVERFKRDEMQNRIEDQRDVTVFNMAISGDDSNGLLARIENEIVARKWPGEEFVIIVSIGTNDSCIDHGKERTPISVYKNNLEKIVQIAKKYSKKVVFIGLPSCDESRTKPVSWGDYVVTNERLQQYDATLESVALQNGIEFIPIFKNFDKAREEKNLLFDGLHPNTEGHELIHKTVMPKIQEILS